MPDRPDLASPDALPPGDDRGRAAPDVPETRYPSFGALGHVMLSDAPASDPVPSETSADRSGRYQILGEIARGGMGAVLRGRDHELGRELAIKVLLDDHRDNPGLVRRFVEEAQIAGQLQHPGIAPVHDVGTFPDGRPYFAMKLVKGRTLAALLKERGDPAAGLDRFLPIFGAIAQTMAYAHARGVIHRDLKPSNVMVGGFGEVQVMDWGLAKVLSEGGAVDERAPAPTEHETVIATARSGSDVDASRPGSALGTPAYMAPEQAVGEVDRVDRRADVFGLGAVLCEILTGRPPHAGRDAGEVLRRAIRGDVTDAHARLGAEGIDPELASLARDCLAPEPVDRPADAGRVAARMTAYFAGVRERLRSADLDRARAEARAVEERKRRKLQVGLAASILALAALGGGAWAWDQRQRADRALRTALAVDQILAQADRLRLEARAVPANPAKWAEARAVAGQAEALVKQARAAAPLRARVAALIEAIQGERAQAEERVRRAEVERSLLSDLESTRGSLADHLDPKRTDAEYAAAFRKAGFDLDTTDPGAVGAWIARGAKAVELASYLDDWAALRAASGASWLSWGRLVAAARVADPDPWRDALRSKPRLDDTRAIEESRRLSDGAQALDVQPAASLLLLALRLENAGDRQRAERVLRRAWLRHPGDFWINFTLARMNNPKDGPSGQQAQPRPEQALRYLSAAAAIRPRSAWLHNNLGIVLSNLDEDAEAEEQFREAIELDPGSAPAHANLGLALAAQGKHAEAAAAFRQAIRLDPDSAPAHANLGLALGVLGYHAEAEDAFRQAIRLKPDDARAHAHLARALVAQGTPAEAEVEFREAIRLDPDSAPVHANLGRALAAQGKPAEAEVEFREAIELDPNYAPAHAYLGHALQSRGKLDEARAELKRGRELSRTDSTIVAGLDRLREQMERRNRQLESRLGAIVQGRDSPSDAAEWLTFAEHCYGKGLHVAAVWLWAHALAADPKLADDRRAQHRYHAAGSATLAGCGEAEDDPPPDDAARARLRAQALDWLKAELAAWARIVERGKPDDRAVVPAALRNWREDTDLFGVREADALARLPEAERERWRALWAEVDALLARAGEGRP